MAGHRNKPAEITQVAGNGLLDRRALLSSGMMFAGAAAVSAAMTAARISRSTRTEPMTAISASRLFGGMRSIDDGTG